MASAAMKGCVFSFIASNFGLFAVVLLFPIVWSVSGDILYLATLLCRRRNDNSAAITSTLKERFAAGIAMSMVPTTIISNVYCLVFLRYTFWWYIPYVLYCTVDKTHSRGGSKILAVRNCVLFRLYAKYLDFEIELVDSTHAAWPRDRSYIFATHPHGVFGTNLVMNFGTTSTDFESSLPIPLEIHPVTLTYNMHMPFLRTALSAMGAISCGVDSLKTVLKKHRHAIALSVGGAKEAELTGTGNYPVVVRSRAGVFRLALQHGSCLVPVYTFGEDDCYRVTSVYFVTYFSTLARKLFGFSIPLFSGGGIFQSSFGFVPLKRKFVTVVGKPILCPLIKDPTPENINTLRETYIAELTDIFNNYKKNAIGDVTAVLEVQ